MSVSVHRLVNGAFLRSLIFLLLVYIAGSNTPAVVGQLHPGDELKIRDSILQSPLRIVHEETYYYPWRDRVRYYTEGGAYQWVEHYDAGGHKWKEGLYDDLYGMTGLFRYYDPAGRLIKTYDYAQDSLVYYHGFIDPYKAAVDSIREITDSILQAKFGKAFFDAHIRFHPVFSWSTRMDPYGRYPDYPDTIPRYLTLVYALFGGEMENGFRLEFSVENLICPSEITLGDEWMDLERFRPRPFRVDYAGIRKMMDAYGYPGEPDLYYDSTARSFIWTCRKVQDTATQTIRELRVNASTGKYKVNVFGESSRESIGCGFISDLDTACYYQPGQPTGMKTYTAEGMHIAVPQDFYMYVHQNYVYHDYLLTDGKDTLRVGWSRNSATPWPPPPVHEGEYGFSIAEVEDRVRSWIGAEQLCGKTLSVHLEHHPGDYTLEIRAIHPGVWMGGGDSITGIISFLHIDPLQINRWEPLIRQLAFY